MCYCQTNLLHGEYSYECNIPDNRTLEMIVLKEEKELIQEGAQRTPMVRLNTWASFNAKTLKVYRNIRNEFVLIFRFVGFYDHESKKYAIHFKAGDETIDLGNIDIIEGVNAGNAMDEYMVKMVTIKEFKKISTTTDLSGKSGTLNSQYLMNAVSHGEI